MVRSTRAAGVAAVAAVAVGMWGVAPASAGSAPTGEAGASGASSAQELTSLGLPAAAGAKKVTLISGDQVWLTRSKDESGRTTVTTRIKAADRPGGEKVTFAQWGTADKYYVVPSDLIGLLGSRVDRRLFDVAGLVDSGASDSSSTRVIVSFAGSAGASVSALDSSARAVTSKAGSAEGAVLSSANAVALSVPAGKGQGLLGLLAPAERGASAAGQAGVSYVSLDGRVKALDTTSMPQIGAPSAWKSGYTGKGVKVAVLDTGVDASHPDLKGQVSAAKDFSRSGSPTDRLGHGTHVASIVAGTGKAGGPGMRGVAYQAKVLNGKVLDDDGYGYDSDIIKGMEWAAKSGADVVNMSLGGGPSDGTDPVEKSVNALSKKYGVMFAIAAGNSGEDGEGGVSSPSTADAALSVAAVDAKNKIASFSDSGPRTGDSALKPDIAAPGVDIKGARSKVNIWGSGSSPYVELSGTSMATPHIAGAAAVLAQARPDLSGAELKSALMGGATDRSGTVWEEGTGVVNIPGSIDLPVIADQGSLSYGAFAYPQSKAKPVTKTLRYRNTSSKPVTLKLKTKVSSANGVTARGVKLSSYGVTVPANGTASVKVTVAPSAEPAGSYAGAITATPAKGHAIRTSIGWINDVQRFNVTVKAVDLNGKPAFAEAALVSVDKGKPTIAEDLLKGQTTFRLPPGTYFAGAFIKAGTTPHGAILGVDPQFTVKGNTTITLGGPKSRQMTVKTPKPAKLTDIGVTYGRLTAGKDDYAVGLMGDGPKNDVWLSATNKPVTVGSSWLTEQATLTGPGAKPAYNYTVGYFTKNRIPASMDHTVTAKNSATSIGTYRSALQQAKAATGWAPRFPGQLGSSGVLREMSIPATVTTYVVGDGARWSNPIIGPIQGGDDQADWWEGNERRFKAGSTTRQDYLTGVMSPGAVSGGIAVRYQNQLIALLPAFEDGQGRSTGGDSLPLRNSLKAYVGSKQIASTNDIGFVVPFPSGKSLRLVQQANRKAPWWNNTTTSTGEWTAPLPTQDRRVLPLMNVQYSLSGRSMAGAVPSGPQTVGLSVAAFTNVKSGGVGVIAPKTLTLEWSIDGGKTWKKAAVKRAGKKATATFTPPAQSPSKSTMVSLRASASDGKGSTVKETTISAYEMTGPAPASRATR